MTATPDKLEIRFQKFLTNMPPGEICPLPPSLLPHEFLVEYNGWRGVDWIDRGVRVWRMAGMTPERWCATVDQDPDALSKSDPRRIGEKIEEIHPEAFETPAHRTMFESWAMMHGCFPGVLLLRGAGPVARKLARLAAEPGSKIEDPESLRFGIGDCVILTVESALDVHKEKDLIRMILQAPWRGNSRLICGRRVILIESYPLPYDVERALRKVGAVDCVLASEACRQPLPNVIFRPLLNSPAMILGQLCGNRDDIYIRGSGEVFIHVMGGWKKANVRWMRVWLLQNFDFYRPGATRRTHNVGDLASFILGCDEFLSRLPKFQIRPLEGETES